MQTRETKQFILNALLEDTFNQDITTNLLVPKNKTSGAYIFVKEDAVLCGLSIVKQVFRKIDKNIYLQTYFKDGDRVKKGTKVMFLEGKTRALLTGERTALNFLGFLSGIATNTYHYVERVYPYKAQILDTRKTTPGLRKLEKYAVRCGGGINHRHNLNEMILIKDNHHQISERFEELILVLKKFRQRNKKPVMIEVDTIKQLKQFIQAEPDFILLDNMSIPQLREAVLFVKNLKGKKPLLEASGGITLETVREVAKTGVDRISTGALTHTYQIIDVSMEITTE